MPLYEYACDRCGRRFTVLVGMTASADSAACPKCGSEQATRVMSRFAKVRPDDDVDEGDMPDPNDPGAMRRWAKEMSEDLGEDLGDEFDEYMDAAEEDGE